MIYYAYGTALLKQDELIETGALDKIREAMVPTSPGRAARRIELLNGSLDIDAARDRVPFEPVAIGRPLTLQITEVYTGKHPSRGLFGGPKDMLLTSAVKSIVTYEAKPRAVNFMTSKVNPKQRLQRPRATDEGTPIMFYSPALIEGSLTLDIDLVFDTFPREAFESVSNAFTAAGGLPIFMAATPYLIAAGQVVRLLGSIGEKLFDGKPSLSTSSPIDVQWPGQPPVPAGFRLISPEDVDRLDPKFRTTYSVNQGGLLVDDDGKQYDGDVPYVIIQVDGTEHEDLQGFTPHAVTAAVLARFFGLGEGQTTATDIIMDAMRLYNDMHFRSDIDRLDRRIAALPADSAERKALEEKRAAVLKNMVTDLLKPPK
jgi:hypothetical protein